MSWASKRTTSRVEDKAYSLMGLFGINMPMLYGEGEKAFIRLQEEIMRTSDDESIFVWTERPNYSLDHGQISSSDIPSFIVTPSEIPKTDSRYLAKICSGDLLAPRPSCFVNSGSIITASPPIDRPPYGLTNKGLRMPVMLFKKAWVDKSGSRHETRACAYIPLNCMHSDTKEHVVMGILSNEHGKLFRITCVLMKTEGPKAEKRYQKHIGYTLSEVLISLVRPDQSSVGRGRVLGNDEKMERVPLDTTVSLDIHLIQRRRILLWQAFLE